MKTIRVNSFKHLKNKNKNAIFLGCGPSINELDKNMIEKINKNLDVWVSNCFLINSEIVPDFYHMEIKPHRSGPLVKRLSKKRSEMYKDTKWIIDQTRSYILDYVSPEDYNIENFYVYPKTYREEDHGKYTPDKDSVSVSVNASLTLISDLMLRMNYDTIYFLGVDMGSSNYFWTNNKKYKNVEIEDIIVTCKAESVPPENPHPTNHLKTYLPEFFKFNNQNVVNLSKNSLLVDRMKTLDIEEVLNEI